MSATNRARGHRALAALVLLAIWASAAAALWAAPCGPTAVQPAGPLGPLAYSQPAGQDLPGPACEIRALPVRPTVAVASVVEGVAGAPALALQAPATDLVAPPARDTLPASRVVAPLQHPPNPIS